MSVKPKVQLPDTAGVSFAGLSFCVVELCWVAKGVYCQDVKEVLFFTKQNFFNYQIIKVISNPANSIQQITELNPTF